MPTAGLEDQFVAALSDLSSTISYVFDQYGNDTLIFLKGDMNASPKNIHRYSLLQDLMTKHRLKRVEHPALEAWDCLRISPFLVYTFSDFLSVNNKGMDYFL